MKLFFAVIAFIFAFNFSALSQEKTFTFKAQVFYKNKALKGAIIEVLEMGDLVFETTTSGSGKFQFELEAEKEYMVEVSMENMRSKAIWINTKRTQDVKTKIPTFAFYVHLEDEEITPYDELSEIPVTLIKYQPKKGEFYMDKSYADAVKNKKKKIKENDILHRR